MRALRAVPVACALAALVAGSPVAGAREWVVAHMPLHEQCSPHVLGNGTTWQVRTLAVPGDAELEAALRTGQASVALGYLPAPPAEDPLAMVGEPFLFHDVAQFARYAASPHFREAAEDHAARTGLLPVALVYDGTQHAYLFSRSKRFTSPLDFRDTRVGATDGPAEQLRRLGAQVVNAPSSILVRMLEEEEIEAAFLPLQAVRDAQGAVESVARHVHVPPVSLSPSVFLVKEDDWSSQSPVVQEALRGWLERAATGCSAHNRRREEALLAGLERAGMTMARLPIDVLGREVLSQSALTLQALLEGALSGGATPAGLKPLLLVEWMVTLPGDRVIGEMPRPEVFQVDPRMYIVPPPPPKREPEPFPGRWRPRLKFGDGKPDDGALEFTYAGQCDPIHGSVTMQGYEAVFHPAPAGGSCSSAFRNIDEEFVRRVRAARGYRLEGGWDEKGHAFIVTADLLDSRGESLVHLSRDWRY